MRNFLKRIVRFLAYLAGSIVILLAIAVGLFRLFLPRLPEYQDDIKGWASAAIGMSVEFSGMDARWGLRGPEVEFYDAELITQDSLARVVSAEQVSVGIALSNLLFDRQAVVDRVVVRDTTLEVRQLADGTWAVQGSPIDQLLRSSSVPVKPIVILQHSAEAPPGFLGDAIADARLDSEVVPLYEGQSLPDLDRVGVQLVRPHRGGGRERHRRLSAAIRAPDAGDAARTGPVPEVPGRCRGNWPLRTGFPLCVPRHSAPDRSTDDT